MEHKDIGQETINTRRPRAEKPRHLVQVDTVHRIYGSSRRYVYTLLDVYSRWAYAAPELLGSEPIQARGLSGGRLKRLLSALRLSRATTAANSLNGLTEKLTEKGIAHRHSRIHTPNDNAHLERFNRTIQEECIARLPGNIAVWNKELPKYLHHYNHERPHMNIDWKTPIEML